MSIRAGHQFIRATRTDAGLRQKVGSLGLDPRLEDIVGLAAGEGYQVEPEALRAAYRQDWALRWLASNDTARGNRDSSASASDE